MNQRVLLEVSELKKYFLIKKDEGLFSQTVPLKAVDGVSFTLHENETLGLVGESGCGKTTLGRTVIRLYEPTGGSIVFDGQEIADLSAKELLPSRRKMHMIFQDPYSSLSPRMNVTEIISESMENDASIGPRERKDRVLELLALVGLNSDHANRFPHEFSGGQRQRIGIARSLAANPKFIVCDEPISALDVSIQAQVVNLLKEIQESHNVAYLFIAHDLSMVQYISDRIGVMYMGHLVELASSSTLMQHPLHPYAQALISSIPVADPHTERTKTRIAISGEIPSLINPPSGCAFRTRCPRVGTLCDQVTPELKEIDADHHVACHLYDK
ncbi:MAG: ATP-binding cassette domain-containing protein [Symbiobacteriaceae bacterium]|nr:ATP-binding cassette domain-containing protein [Symbiobacteriaceae bacterium]